MLLTPGGHDRRPGQTCLFEDPLRVTSDSGHWSMHSFQVSSTYPTGMLSCYLHSNMWVVQILSYIILRNRNRFTSNPKIYPGQTLSSFIVHEISANGRSLMVGPQCLMLGYIWGKSAWIGEDSLKASWNCLPLKWFELFLSITVNVIVSE